MSLAISELLNVKEKGGINPCKVVLLHATLSYGGFMTRRDIISQQIEGKVFQTWSNSGKARNIDFTVDSVDQKGITFLKSNGKRQRATWVQADSVIENWDMYKNKQIERADLAGSNFCTSYLFGLLRGIETVGSL